MREGGWAGRKEGKERGEGGRERGKGRREIRTEDMQGGVDVCRQEGEMKRGKMRSFLTSL